MRSERFKRFITLIGPEGLAVLAACAVASSGLLDGAGVAARRYAVIVAGVGIVLGWRFHRGRILFVLMVLALADRAMAFASTLEPLPAAGALGDLIGVLLPLNLTAIALLPERGFLTRHGAWQVAALAAQVALVAMLALPIPSPVAGRLTQPIVPWSTLAATVPTQPVLLSFLVAFGVFTPRLVVQPDSERRSMWWVTAACALAVSAGSPPHATVYFATAGLTLVIGIIEASHAMAYRDALTGLPGRRAWNDAVDRLEAGGVGGTRYTVAMVDVDRFKKFNDQHGHEVGDQVLHMVASHLQRIGGGGRVYRYGGEEFAVLFPGRSRDDCLPHLEDARHAVREATFTIRGRGRPPRKPATPSRGRGRGQLSVTVSIGVAERNGRYKTPAQVVKAADRALYRAKRTGRDRVAR